MTQLGDYEIKILRKMLVKRIIGKNDKYEHAILTGFPSHEHKKLRKALEKLVKMGYIVSRPKLHGIKYGLNPRLIDEIYDILK